VATGALSEEVREGEVTGLADPRVRSSLVRPWRIAVRTAGGLEAASVGGVVEALTNGLSSRS
jgi:hypothetical protein